MSCKTRWPQQTRQCQMRLSDSVFTTVGVLPCKCAYVMHISSRAYAAQGLARGHMRSKVCIRNVASPMGRRYIQFSDGSLQSRLTLRVAVCD